MVWMFVTVTINSKGFDTNIQANNSICNRERNHLYFTKDAYVIFAACRAANGCLANLTFDVAAFVVAHSSERWKLNIFIVYLDTFWIGGCVGFFSVTTLVRSSRCYIMLTLLIIIMLFSHFSATKRRDFFECFSYFC